MFEDLSFPEKKIEMWLKFGGDNPFRSSGVKNSQKSFKMLKKDKLSQIPPLYFKVELFQILFTKLWTKTYQKRVCNLQNHKI